MELFHAILYMLAWQNNNVIETMVDEKGRAGFMQYVREMQRNDLATKLKKAYTFLMPLYFFQKYCDANYPGSFSVAISKWGDYGY